MLPLFGILKSQPLAHREQAEEQRQGVLAFGDPRHRFRMHRVNRKQQAAQPSAGDFQLAQHHPEHQSVERMHQDVHDMERGGDGIRPVQLIVIVPPQLVFHPKHRGLQREIVRRRVGSETVTFFATPDFSFYPAERRAQQTDRERSFRFSVADAVRVFVLLVGDAARPDFPKPIPVRSKNIGVGCIRGGMAQGRVRRNLLIVIPKKTGRHRRNVNHHRNEKERHSEGQRVCLL